MDWWNWLREHDVPNWIVGVIWPAVLSVGYWFWQGRKVQNVPGLEVALSHYSENPPEALFTFRNRTDSPVYLTKVGIRCSRLFPVRADATRDIVSQSCELKFGKKWEFWDREVLISINDEKISGLGLNEKLSEEIIRYQPSWVKKVLGIKKYYTLEYVAVVGTRKYRVRTIK
jgi:hypothetical protein